MKKIIVISLILATSLYSFSQEIKKVTGAKGRYIISGNVSEEEATNKALAEAKLNALKLAGVAEHIQSYDMLFKSEVGTKFEEVFMSDMQSEIRGAVRNFDMTAEKGIDELKNFYIEVTIDAEVILYTVGSDPAFKVRIEGIKQGYQDGEKLFYTVTPTQNCYLTIFNLYEKNATVIFPNPYEQQQLFEAGKSYKFPLTELIDGYDLVKTTKEPEKNKQVFVFTKDNIPYIKYLLIDGDQVTSFGEMSTWIFSISPDKRVSYFESFVIY